MSQPPPQTPPSTLEVPLWKKKLPMQLTMSRVYAVPLILWGMAGDSLGAHFVAALIFILASITDYYDGMLARKFNAVSTMGKFMDPVTDKILVSSVLIVLVAMNRLDAYLVILLLIRDTFVGGIRSVAAADQVVIAAKASGKWKTGLQMAAIPAVMLGMDLPSPLEHLHRAGYFVLWFSVVLSLWSGWEYYQIFKAQSRSAQ